MGKANGIVTISDRAVMQLASYGARNCRDVAEMTDVSNESRLSRIVKGLEDTAGVYVKKTKSGVVLDVYIACRYGADTNQVKVNTEKAVRTQFEGTGITVKDVIIHINSVK